MNGKSATQTLFDRLVTTWIIPEVEKRAGQNLTILPFNLKASLIVWENLNEPRILLNDEIDTNIVELQVNTIKPAPDGQPISPLLIHSLIPYCCATTSGF